MQPPAVRRAAAPVYVEDYLAISASPADAIEAASAAATLAGTVPGLVDFRTDRALTVARAVAIDEADLTLRGGRVVASGNTPTMVITGSNVTFERMRLTRPTTTGDTDTSADRSNVVVNATDFKAFDCTVTDANLAGYYLTHGTCNGARIARGKITNSSARQNACGIYAAAGSTGNVNIHVDAVTITGTGCPDGILIFDAAACVVRNCRVSELAILPTVTLTGWANVSGNVYRQRTATGSQTTDRADGSTRTLKNGGTQLAENTSTPTTPSANQWGISGGYVYINLNGTNPSTQTITSDIVSGYGITFYGSVGSYTGSFTMSDNLVESNRIVNVDGFGIYMQLALTSATGNATKLNRLRSVCRKGVQNTSLPFAGIGWTGGTDCQMVGDTVYTIGDASFPAPGVRMLPGGLSSTCTGSAVGVKVNGASTSGWQISSTDWTFTDCTGHNNLQHGFTCATGVSGDSFLRNTLMGCRASGNTLSGVNVAGTVAGTKASLSVLGGAFNSNTQRGIVVNAGQDCRIIGPECASNGSTSFAQIQLTGTSTRCTVDDVTVTTLITATRGVLLDNTIVNCSLGKVHNALAATPTYVVSIGSGLWLTQAGAIGFGATYLGNGTPESVLTAAVGAVAHRLDGGAGTCMYVKESGTGNTGWIAK